MSIGQEVRQRRCRHRLCPAVHHGACAIPWQSTAMIQHLLRRSARAEVEPCCAATPPPRLVPEVRGEAAVRPPIGARAQLAYQGITP